MDIMIRRYVLKGQRRNYWDRREDIIGLCSSRSNVRGRGDRKLRLEGCRSMVVSIWRDRCGWAYKLVEGYSY